MTTRFLSVGQAQGSQSPRAWGVEGASPVRPPAPCRPSPGLTPPPEEMARMNRPAPVEVSYKGMRFLITHNPTNATLSTFVQVSGRPHVPHASLVSVAGGGVRFGAVEPSTALQSRAVVPGPGELRGRVSSSRAACRVGRLGHGGSTRSRGRPAQRWKEQRASPPQPRPAAGAALGWLWASVQRLCGKEEGGVPL